MLLSTRTAGSVRPMAASSTRRPTRVVLARAGPKDEALQSKVQQAIQEAEDTCTKTGADAAHCAAAWDNVEEISATIAHKKVSDEVTNANDPLEQFCGENPDADECRVYED